MHALTTCYYVHALSVSAGKVMDPEVYLKKHYVLTYVEDAVSFLLERKDEDSKTKPFELLAEYFMSIKTGTHILFREYSFICATPHNRISFVKLFWQSYAEIASRNEMMKVAEYLSLLRLHCHDFPTSMVFKIAQVMFTHNAMDNLVSFSDFLYTFQTVFYYEYFIGLCEGMCYNILSGQTPQILLGGSSVIVSMPSATEQDGGSRPTTASSSCAGDVNEVTQTKKTSASETDLGSKHIDSDVFVPGVMSLIQKLQEKEPWENCPSVNAIYEVIGVQDKLTFFDFVLSMTRSEAVNTEIGVLPLRGEFVGSTKSTSTSTDKDSNKT